MKEKNGKPVVDKTLQSEIRHETGITFSKDDLTATVKAVRDAMNVIVPGPMAVMKWIEQEVAKAIDRGADFFSGSPLRISPSIKS